MQFVVAACVHSQIVRKSSQVEASYGCCCSGSQSFCLVRSAVAMAADVGTVYHTGHFHFSFFSIGLNFFKLTRARLMILVNRLAPDSAKARRGSLLLFRHNMLCLLQQTRCFVLARGTSGGPLCFTVESRRRECSSIS